MDVSSALGCWCTILVWAVCCVVNAKWCLHVAGNLAQFYQAKSLVKAGSVCQSSQSVSCVDVDLCVWHGGCIVFLPSPGAQVDTAVRVCFVLCCETSCLLCIALSKGGTAVVLELVLVVIVGSMARFLITKLAGVKLVCCSFSRSGGG